MDTDAIKQTIGNCPEVELLHEIASRMAAADPLQEVLTQIVDFAALLVSCDSCLLYALEDGELVLRASKNAHPDVLDRMKLRQGITGWVVEHKQPVAVALNASQDPRLQLFKDLAEDRFEAFLSVPVLCRGRVVGVINLQNREPHEYTEHEITLISTIGFLVGTEIEMARLKSKTCISLKNWRRGNSSSARKGFSSANSESQKKRHISEFNGRAGSGANR